MGVVEKVVQVLLFREKGNAARLGPALGAAAREVEALYNHGVRQTPFERVVVTAESMEPLADSIAGTWLSGAPGWPALWSGPPGSHASGYEARHVGEGVRRILGPRAEGAWLGIVMDERLTPPEGWRYVVWDDFEGGTVVSWVPTDPFYWGWGNAAANRIGVIKRRVRAACCSTTGEALGFRRCRNSSCFLYGGVNSVVHLDRMVCVGAEHGSRELSGLGFRRLEGDSEIEPLGPVGFE
ncbi:MAG TPA: hypothetical protein VKF62_00945, partial [Planctomycetota bacterium]|nr:hypothetical protein [Planctomycetota bacterium]